MRLAASLGLALAAVLALIWLSFNFDPWGRLKRAKAETAVATEQAAGATEATRQLDHYVNTVTIVKEKADAAVQVVQAQPGADAPLDPARRAVLCAQLAGLRGSPVCTDPDPRPDLP